VSTSSDPDSNTAPSSNNPQAAELEVRKPEVVLPATTGDLPEYTVDGRRDVDSKALDPANGETRSPSNHPVAAQDAAGAGVPAELLEAILKSLAAQAFAQNANNQGHSDVEPKPREMDVIDLGTFVVASRYRTLNVVMILLAVAVCVAAWALGSHSNLVFTVSITSASTAAVALGVSAAKQRRARHKDSKADTNDTKHGPENDNSA
jgi:hypothetical protein